MVEPHAPWRRLRYVVFAPFLEINGNTIDIIYCVVDQVMSEHPRFLGRIYPEWFTGKKTTLFINLEALLINLNKAQVQDPSLICKYLDLLFIHELSHDCMTKHETTQLIVKQGGDEYVLENGVKVQKHHVLWDSFIWDLLDEQYGTTARVLVRTYEKWSPIIGLWKML